MSPAERYAHGLSAWQARRRWKRRRAMYDSWEADKAGHYADVFADPARGLTHFERREMEARGPFGARR